MIRKQSLGISAILAGSLLSLVSIAGCQGTEAAKAAGGALQRSTAVLNPLTELGIRARAADAGMTLEAFREANGVSAISESEAAFIRNTITEQNETIRGLTTYGEETP